MAKTLTQAIQNQITAKDIKSNFVFTVGGNDYTDYLLSYNLSYDTKYGSASAIFTLNNDGGIFGASGANAINVGDIVSLIEKYTGDSTEFNSFYGKVEQRSISKNETSRIMTITCLDYISMLQQWDIDKHIEGTKVEVTNETLTPNYLSSPNDMYAQVFDFANNSLAQNPGIILMVRDRYHETDDPQFDGYDIHYDTGQVKFGSPLNALDNYDVIAKSYYFYTEGVYGEDVLEQLITEPNGYGEYIFGESSATAVIDNHLTTTFQDEEGGYLDFLTPNLTSSTITIKHQLAQAYDPDGATPTVLYLESVEGLPASGSGSLNGDAFTWTNINESENKLEGIPTSGSYALSSHPIEGIVSYEYSYPAGQVWYLKYSNVRDNLTASNFTIPVGASFRYFDSRMGRIILSGPLSTSATVRCDYNYRFKTLQTCGIEINGIDFRSREVKNRYDAISKLKEYLPPNYVIRTQGDNKIWASLMSQKTTADYDLELVKNYNYLEDEDLYTRVLLYGNNKNPTNLMYDDSVTFLTTGQSYKGYTSQSDLSYVKSEDGWHIFESGITDAGYIRPDDYPPIVYIDGIAIDNQLHQMIRQPMKVVLTTRTETTTTSGGKGEDPTTTTTSFYYYKIYLAHQNIEPSQTITVYDLNGIAQYTVNPYDSRMDYGRGIYTVPGDQQNSMIETLSTATYWVMYSTDALDIDYDNVRFKINENILPAPEEADVTATFEYYTVFTAADGTQSIMDGRWDTQVQTEFFAQPPAGYEYAILDLGQTRAIQAIDVIAGYYKPDEHSKFDIDIRVTLEYSTDNENYYELSDETHSVSLVGGQSVSFEEKDLGVGLEARYIKVILENVKRIEYGDKGIYPVAFTEVSMYSDVVLKSEATLIDTCTLTADVNPGETTINVDSTYGFTDPDSGETETAYIADAGYFTYTGLTSTSFVGVTLDSGVTGSDGGYVYQSEESDTTLYDKENLIRKMGDRVYKGIKTSGEYLYTQEELDNLSKNYLEEFYKNHTKISCNVMYAPYLKVGQTVSVTDTYNNISNGRYFIESVKNNSGNFNLVLAKYPE